MRFAAFTLLLVSLVSGQNLDQGWTKDIAHRFWYLDQGSRLLPYSWFLNLECPKSPAAACPDRTRFITGLERYGFVTGVRMPDLNADGLPIGFARDDDSERGAWVGLTCAACHSTQMDFPGVGKIFIEGAPNMLDNDKFYADVVAAVNETLEDKERLARFSAAVKGGPDLESQMRAVAALLNKRKRINTPDVAAGFGRVDAFGQIFNQVTVMAMGNAEETAPAPNAPASYPFLWDIAQHKAVQWNGSAPNLGELGTGSMLRNVGEVIGVFGEVKVVPASGLGLPRYPSSVRTDNLKQIEAWIANLHSPVWPGPIDKSRLASGRRAYEKAKCGSCHAVIDRIARKYPLPVTMTPLSDVGTDPRLIDNIRLRYAYSSALQGKKTLVDARDPLSRFGEVVPARDLAVHVTMGAYLGKEAPATSLKIVDQFIKDSARSLADGPAPPASYKARPLNGIWATAPYLHNGSVPNLTELLNRPEERMTEFCIGNSRFDPVNVGYDTSCEGRSFRLDTRIPGNRNIGHNYGTDLSADEKRDLVEYLKSL
jgi:hypothetical protein